MKNLVTALVPACVCVAIVAAHPLKAFSGDPSVPAWQGACEAAPLMHQQRDGASIQRLEASWSAAVSQGDAGFERCLLTPDFVEILSGELKTRADELEITARNKGRKGRVPELPQISISIHGNVAVARAIWKPASATHLAEHIVDCFVWEDGAWHAFFSQVAPVEDKNPSRFLHGWPVI